MHPLNAYHAILSLILKITSVYLLFSKLFKFNETIKKFPIQYVTHHSLILFL